MDSIPCNRITYDIIPLTSFILGTISPRRYTPCTQHQYHHKGKQGASHGYPRRYPCFSHTLCITIVNSVNLFHIFFNLKFPFYYIFAMRLMRLLRLLRLSLSILSTLSFLSISLCLLTRYFIPAILCLLSRHLMPLHFVYCRRILYDIFASSAGHSASYPQILVSDSLVIR